jgi:hypothetical protein
VGADALKTVLMVARAAEGRSQWRPGDWPDLAVELLLAEFGDPEIAELAGLPASVSGWETEALVSSLYDRYDVREPPAEEAAVLLGQLMAADLRARPANVTAPVTRLLARLASPGYESDLANRACRSAEYLDCDCIVTDLAIEAELQGLQPLELPAGVVRVLARPLRSTLPLTQPPHGH